MRIDKFEVDVAEKGCVIKKYCGKERVVVVPETLKVNGAELPVAEIGDRAFENCSSLKKVVLPDSVKVIGSEAFCGCHDLKDLNIPKDLECLRPSAFEYTHLELGLILTNDGKKCLGWIGDNQLCQYLVVPEGVEEICDRAFMHLDVKRLVLPKSLKKIAEGAFFCSYLEEIAIPEGVEEIAEDAFDSRIDTIYISEKTPVFTSLVSNLCGKPYRSGINDLVYEEVYIYNEGRILTVCADTVEDLQHKVRELQTEAELGDVATADVVAKQLLDAERVFTLLDWQMAEIESGYSFPLVGSKNEIFIFQRLKSAKGYIDLHKIKRFDYIDLIGAFERNDMYNNVANMLKMALSNGIERVVVDGLTSFCIADLLDAMGVGDKMSFNARTDLDVIDRESLKLNPVALWRTSPDSFRLSEKQKGLVTSFIFNPKCSNLEELSKFTEDLPIHMLCYAQWLLRFSYLPLAEKRGDKVMVDYFKTLCLHFSQEIVSSLGRLRNFFVFCDKQTHEICVRKLNGKKYIYIAYTDMYCNKSPYEYVNFWDVNHLSHLLEQYHFDGIMVTDGPGLVAVIDKEECVMICYS